MVEEKEWYYGILSPDDLSNYLKKPGDFLLRCQHMEFILSVKTENRTTTTTTGTTTGTTSHDEKVFIFLIYIFVIRRDGEVFVI